MTPSASPVRPWYLRLQVSLRSLLILTLLCALVMAWVYYEREKIAAKRAAIYVITSNNGSVSTTETRFSWFHRLLGDERPGKVTQVALRGRSTGQQISALAEFVDLQTLLIFFDGEWESQSQLPPLRKLKSLHVSVEGGSNANFPHLHLSTALESVRISVDHVDGEILREFHGFEHLGRSLYWRACWRR